MSNWVMRRTSGGERYLVCVPLEAEGLPHAFTLRREDAAPGGGRERPIEIARALGHSGASIAVPAQVHGNAVAVPDGSGFTNPRSADAVVVLSAGAAAVATADCVGAIAYAPHARAFAVIHAGWRGTLAGALPAAIRSLGERTGAGPASTILALGPAIGGCCYSVGEDVAAPFRAAFPAAPAEGVFGSRSGATTIDLAAVNRLQAERAGVARSRIHAAGVCTACRIDLCWSFRVEGAAAGRLWTLGVLQDDGSAGRRP